MKNEEQEKKRLEIKNLINTHQGSDVLYKHQWGGFRYTMGIKDLALEAGAVWLINAIFSYMRHEDFQIWTLNVRAGRAILTMREDSGRPPVVKQKIEFTDFPRGRWRFYLEYGVLMLPRER